MGRRSQQVRGHDRTIRDKDRYTGGRQHDRLRDQEENLGRYRNLPTHEAAEYDRIYGGGAEGRREREYESEYEEEGPGEGLDEEGYSFSRVRAPFQGGFRYEQSGGPAPYSRTYEPDIGSLEEAEQRQYADRPGRRGGPERTFRGRVPREGAEANWGKRSVNSTISGEHIGKYAGKAPKGYQRSDERIMEEINDRLTEHGEIDPSDVEVKVEQGEVTLTGTIENRRAKRLAEDVAESVAGVRDVINQIRIRREEASSPGGQMERR